MSRSAQTYRSRAHWPYARLLLAPTIGREEDNGQLALKAAGLVEQFRQLIQAGAESQYVHDKDANILLYKPDKGIGGRPEVHRGNFAAFCSNLFLLARCAGATKPQQYLLSAKGGTL